MRRLIHVTFLTIFETFILLLFCLFLLLCLGFSSLDFTGLIFLYLGLLVLLVALKNIRLRWKRFLVFHFSLQRIDRMSGIEFEEYLKLRFKALGFQVETTKTSGDYGADLILQKKKHIIAVQAKRYQGKIGVRAVQEVIGSMAYYEAKKGLVVTNSYYTQHAKKLAEANSVLLWDRDILARMAASENMASYVARLLE